MSVDLGVTVSALRAILIHLGQTRASNPPLDVHRPMQPMNLKR